jgi:hypothetical protein
MQLKDVRTIIPMSQRAAIFPWQACTSTGLEGFFILTPPKPPTEPLDCSVLSHHILSRFIFSGIFHLVITLYANSFFFLDLGLFCQGVSDLRQFMQLVNAFNAPLSWLRVIKYMEALSPNTRQVGFALEKEVCHHFSDTFPAISLQLTQTVGNAGSDLLVLGVSSSTQCASACTFRV